MSRSKQAVIETNMINESTTPVITTVTEVAAKESTESTKSTESKGFDFSVVNIDGLQSKSAKMRAYAAAGAKTGDIAKHMGVKYQFVRNVLVAAAGKASTNDAD